MRKLRANLGIGRVFCEQGALLEGKGDFWSSDTREALRRAKDRLRIASEAALELAFATLDLERLTDTVEHRFAELIGGPARSESRVWKTSKSRPGAAEKEEDILRAYALGANAYARKPVDFGEFPAAAEELGLFWLLSNELPASA